MLDADQQFARIEVFNSLAVTAPQIELDRLRNDRRFNVTGALFNRFKNLIYNFFYSFHFILGVGISVDEYSSARVRATQSEGTLCLSTSKLALAFCILGMIFLIAVIVAICCLIWGKSKSSRWVHGTHSVRGAFSSR